MIDCLLCPRITEHRILAAAVQGTRIQRDEHRLFLFGEVNFLCGHVTPFALHQLDGHGGRAHVVPNSIVDRMYRLSSDLSR